MSRIGMYGISLGGVTLSPGAILTFLVIFAVGYLVTRGVQGAFRNSILPKTKLDAGGQNAVIGVRHIGHIVIRHMGHHLDAIFGLYRHMRRPRRAADDHYRDNQDHTNPHHGGSMNDDL